MRLIVPLEMADMTGGMLQSVRLLLRFVAARTEKIVFVPAASRTAEPMRETGAEVVRSREDVWTVDRKAPIRTAATFVNFRRELSRLLTTDSIILTNNIATELLCGLGSPWSRTPRVFVNRGNEYRGVSMRALRRSLKSAHLCVATTGYQEKTLNNCLEVDSGRIRIIPNGVDLTEMERAKDQRRPEWYEEGWTHVATIGYPSAQKNQELLVRSIAVLRGEGTLVRGVIIGSPGSSGDQAYMEHLIRLIAELKMERDVKLIPFMEDKRKMFSGIDILASTSTREGFGRTIIEAMASSCPVVALRAGGPEMILDDGVTGVLVADNNTEAFAAGIRQIVNSTTFRENLIRNGLTRCRTLYDGRKVADQYNSLFEECLGSKKYNS